MFWKKPRAPAPTLALLQIVRPKPDVLELGIQLAQYKGFCGLRGGISEGGHPMDLKAEPCNSAAKRIQTPTTLRTLPIYRQMADG